MPGASRWPRAAAAARGFTLVELLVALAVMALLALLGWRGLDGMVRTHEHTRARAQAHAVLQTSLAQWSADLDALQPLEHTLALDWDGQVLRLTRRASVWPDPGALVVAWTRRNYEGQPMWLRWQSPPLQTLGQWQQAWDSAAQWARNPGDAERAGEVALLPLEQWRLLYYRGGAWSNPQSSAASTTANTADAAGAAGAFASPRGGEAAPASTLSRTPLPEGVRLEITLPPGPALQGTLTYDWFNPASPATP